VRLEKRVETLGWSPSCACPAADPIPCTVLDPFGGAGTVALEADRLGRDAILVELNPTYAKMAEDRIRGAAPMFATVEVA
jgi:16S rRNA G966 N2-methylase RsmD